MPDRAEPSASGTSASAGSQIGPYKLLEKIGEGGFGEVWLAEQREPVKRRVAVKIIKLGMDTRQVVARFEAERQALAMMDHPSIAKVLDAGATDLGRPFFVMELVKGIPITDYCQRNNVALPERLHLFIQVCRAIQHAHQKGIIHRDIKPSNILVTMQDGSAVPKVIDFGIAKATQMELTEKTLHTQLNQFIGTPAYMSPEQAEMTGIDIDTRSDIYSLGVLLYELLTGTTPFETRELLSAGLDEMRRMIREKEPVRPSTRLKSLTQSRIEIQKSKIDEFATLHSSLSTDLDWIVLKCLEKNRTRRYETANGLALDVQRHLGNEPVTARPPSPWYRFEKSFRRNRLAYVAAALVLTAIFASIVGISIFAGRESHARVRESIQRGRAENNAAAALQNEIKTRQALYAADMLLAFQAFETGNAGRARELLSRYGSVSPGGPDLRGWEWWHLSEATRSRDLFTLRGHSNYVLASLFLKDGRTIFSAGTDGTVRFWDIPSRSNVATFPYPFWPRCADLSPDGRWVLLGSAQWSVWDTAERKMIIRRPVESQVNGVAFSPKGDLCALVSDRVYLLTVPDFKPFQTLSRGEGSHNDFLNGVAFSPDGKSLAFGQISDEVILADLSTGGRVALGKARRGDPLALAFSPDGKRLAMADRAGILVWNVLSRELAHSLADHREQVLSIAFSPDGSLFASSSGDQTVKLYDAATFACFATFTGHEHEVHNVKFSPDSRFLLSSSQDETIRVWEARHRLRPQKLTVQTPAFLDHWTLGYRFFFTNENGLNAIELPELEQRQYPLPPSAAAATRIVPNATASVLGWVSNSGDLSVWDVASNSERALLSGAKIAPEEQIAISPNGNLLSILRSSGHVEVWDLAARRLFQTYPPMIRDTSPAGGHTYYPSESTRTVFLSDALLHRSHHLFDNKRWEFFRPGATNILSLRNTHRSQVAYTAADNAGELFASASFDGTIKVSDLKTGHELRTLRGQLIGFTSVAFSHDRSRLAAGGFDGTITLWQLPSFHQVGHWKAHPRNTRWLAFLPNDEYLASARLPDPVEATEDAEIALWSAPKR